MKKAFMLLCAMFMTGIGTSQASVIVDTGPGPDGSGGYTLASYQWLAAEFSITESVTVDSIEGWIGGGGAGEVGTIAIYSDGGELPGTELYSTGFSADLWNSSWQGAGALDWALAAGTYWVSFEVRATDTLQGWMAYPSASPLGNEAFTNSSGWNEYDSLSIGVKINGEQIGVVPVPATLMLMALGLVGMAYRGKKQAA